MSLTKHPTPITDAADRVIAGETPYEHNVRRSVAMADLERQLAEAAKARDDYFAAWTTCIKKRGDIKQQRDTLAEALRKARCRLAYNSLLDQHDPIDAALATLQPDQS